MARRRAEPDVPRLAQWIVRLLVPRAERDFFLGDLREAFVERHRTEGAKRAARWYWRQALLSIPTFTGPRRRSRQPRNREGIMRTIATDLRYGSRSLRRSPLFTLAALTILSLGIGSTVALFSVIKAVLLDPPIFEDPANVVRLFETREGGASKANMSYPDIVDVRERSTTLVDVIAKQSWMPTLLGSGDPARLRGASVSAGFFDILGLRPVEGRFFTEEEDELGHEPVVVLGHHVWLERFGADPAIVGSPVDLSGTSYTVVGVAPAEMEDLDGHLDLWRARPPYFDENVLSRTGHNMRPIARIAPGYTLEQVNAELKQISDQLVSEYPDDKAGDGMIAVPIMDLMVGPSRVALLTLLGAVGTLLLIACANVANLLLSRATARRREMAMRAALGASTGRITTQLLTESVLLAGLGGAGGIALAVAGVRIFVSLGAAIPRADRIVVDGPVLLFAVVLAVIVGVLFGLTPALQLAKPDLVADLRDGDRAVGGPRSLGLKNALVVAETALALVLLTGAGLLGRSLANLRGVDPGIRTDHVLTMTVDPANDRYPKHSDLTRFWRETIERVNAIPGVRTAGAVSFLPMSGGYEGQGIRRADRPEPRPEERMGSEARAVTPDYFQTMGMTLVRGRGFTAADDSGSVQVAVINEALAGQLFRNEDPIGKRVIIQSTPWEIVGVVADVRQFGVLEDARPEIYAPHPQPFVPWIRGTMDLAVRTDSDPLSVAAQARRTIWDLDPNVPITNVKTMEQWATEDIAAPRFRTYLLGLFAVMAVTLAAVGMASVLAYSVSHRTREFGVRIALGATTKDLVRMVLSHGARLVGLGMGLGVVASLAIMRVLDSVLFNVAPTDVTTFVTVAAILAAVALVSATLPAVQASRVSPSEAMRMD